MPETHLARWWRQSGSQAVVCELCPRRCHIPEGGHGYCAVRENHGGTLYALAYGRPVAVAIDPIEKKPLARFMPHTRTFSLGTFGCNLGCVFCQNDSLSRGRYSDQSAPLLLPGQIVELAKRHNCPSISYTYNEPTVFAEYVIDIAHLARQEGLKNILISNGYIAEDAASDLYPLMDAANIDMKGFSEDFYQEMCSATLPPVLHSLRRLHELGVHLEITTLVIPGKNDNREQMEEWVAWLRDNLGLDIPLHFTAYHPACHCRIRPTSAATLHAIRGWVTEMGCRNVFLGNLPQAEAVL